MKWKRNESIIECKKRQKVTQNERNNKAEIQGLVIQCLQFVVKGMALKNNNVWMDCGVKVTLQIIANTTDKKKKGAS